VSVVHNVESNTIEDKTTVEWTPEEKKDIPPRYGCEILIENGTVSQIKDPSFPNDAYLILYRVNDETYVDLCRGTRVKIFDMYYDKFGPGSVQKIDFGYGRVSPKVWGYRAPEKKRRK
jgi:hypothetical protein